jgi:hypothetical protein
LDGAHPFIDVGGQRIVGRKPLSKIRGTHFAAQRQKFANNRRQRKDADAWYLPPVNTPSKEQLEELERLAFNVSIAELRYQEALEELKEYRRRSVNGFNRGDLFVVESVSSYAESDTSEEVYVTKNGFAVFSIRVRNGALAPATIEVEDNFGRKSTAYRRDYLRFIEKYDEWERRITFVMTEYKKPKRVARKREYLIYQNEPVDPWEIRLKFILEAD